MSVQTLSDQEIKDLFGMMKFHEETLKESLPEYFDLQIILRTLNMALIANRVAYAVQYKELKETVSFEDITIDFTKKYNEIDPIKCQKKELWYMLSKLHYNLFTNNGFIFLQDEFEKILQKILVILK